MHTLNPIASKAIAITTLSIGLSQASFPQSQDADLERTIASAKSMYSPTYIPIYFSKAGFENRSSATQNIRIPGKLARILFNKDIFLVVLNYDINSKAPTFSGDTFSYSGQGIFYMKRGEQEWQKSFSTRPFKLEPTNGLHRPYHLQAMDPDSSSYSLDEDDFKEYFYKDIQEALQLETKSSYVQDGDMTSNEIAGAYLEFIERLLLEPKVETQSFDQDPIHQALNSDLVEKLKTEFIHFQQEQQTTNDAVHTKWLNKEVTTLSASFSRLVNLFNTENYDIFWVAFLKITSRLDEFYRNLPYDRDKMIKEYMSEFVDMHLQATKPIMQEHNNLVENYQQSFELMREKELLVLALEKRISALSAIDIPKEDQDTLKMRRIELQSVFNLYHPLKYRTKYKQTINKTEATITLLEEKYKELLEEQQKLQNLPQKNMRTEQNNAQHQNSRLVDYAITVGKAAGAIVGLYILGVLGLAMSGFGRRTSNNNSYRYDNPMLESEPTERYEPEWKKKQNMIDPQSTSDGQ